MISIIVPILDEIEQLPDLMAHLRQWQSSGCEIILVDGGSCDDSANMAAAAGFSVLRSPRGRARQMNAGAAQSNGAALVFLHADTRLPADADDLIRDALQAHCWGRFDVRLTGGNSMLGVIAFFMNWRSRIKGIATGDQAIFVAKAIFEAAGGFPDQPLMEDIEMSKRLKQWGRPHCLRARVITSGRRWTKEGIGHTVWLMWRLRWAYWRGKSADQLAREYR